MFEIGSKVFVVEGIVNTLLWVVERQCCKFFKGEQKNHIQ